MIGFLKNDPALRLFSSFGAISMALLARISRTAFRTCDNVGLDEDDAKYRFKSAYSKRGARPGKSAYETRVTMYRPFCDVLNMLVRYRKPHSELESSRVSPEVTSMTRTVVMVSATSCPYAPTFCTGVPPTVPGIPLRHSRPARFAPTVCATNESQSQPAPATKIVSPCGGEKCDTPLIAILSTIPKKPAS